MPQELEYPHKQRPQIDTSDRGSPSQKVPASPKQANSSLVEMGFMFFLILNIKLQTQVLDFEHSAL